MALDTPKHTLPCWHAAGWLGASSAGTDCSHRGHMGWGSQRCSGQPPLWIEKGSNTRGTKADGTSPNLQPAQQQRKPLTFLRLTLEVFFSCVCCTAFHYDFQPMPLSMLTLEDELRGRLLALVGQTSGLAIDHECSRLHVWPLGSMGCISSPPVHFVPAACS